MTETTAVPNVPIAAIPIVLCEQVPSNESAPLLLGPGQPCPFCGEPIADHDTIDDVGSAPA